MLVTIRGLKGKVIDMPHYPKFREAKIWDSKATITRENYTMHLEYETEPPFGDFIYSVKFIFDNTSILFPFWIYGRSIIFYDNFVVVQAVESGSYHGIHSIIIDINARKYIRLNTWYDNYTTANNMLVLVDTSKDKRITVNETLFCYNKIHNLF